MEAQIMKLEAPFDYIYCNGEVGKHIGTYIVGENRIDEDGKYTLETHSHPIVQYLNSPKGVVWNRAELTDCVVLCSEDDMRIDIRTFFLLCIQRAGQKTKEAGDDYEFVKLLVEHGADVNYMDKFQNSAIRKAMRDEKYDVALYLLKHGADYNVPISRICYHGPGISYDSTYLNLVEELRYDMSPLDSKEYKAKMKIVEFLKKKGGDYRSYPIPEYIKKSAKKDYPDSWKEYLEKY